MNSNSFYNFYQYAVLPQFGFKAVDVVWTDSQRTGPDEFAHYFTSDNTDYALIFEDYDGLGRNDKYIREYVLEQHTKYEFIKPTSDTGNSPSYDGFHPPVPYQYCENVTGTFTLIKMF